MLLIGIFISAVLFWQILRQRLKRRVIALRNMRSFVLNVGDSIRIAKRNIFDIISENKIGWDFFENVDHSGELLYPYYEKAKKKNGEKLCLKERDEATFDRYFAHFGTGDINTQLLLCDETVSDIEKNLRDAEDEERRYGKMYTVAGLCSGAFAVILLI